MLKRTEIFLIVIIFFFLSCSAELDKKAYIKWVKDPRNGLLVKENVNEYAIELQYTPAEFVILQSGEDLTKEELQEALEEYQHLQYYTLRVSTLSSQDFIEFATASKEERQKKLYYFSYHFQNDIEIEEDGERYPCVLFHFERNGSLKNSRTFILGFENKGSVPVAESKVIINSAYFGSPVTMSVKKENIPNVRL